MPRSAPKTRSKALPLAEAIKLGLLKKISRGQLAPDQPVPSITDLMDEHGVGRSTARQVVEDLLNDGVIYKRPGLGTFVTNFEILGRKSLCVLLRGAGIGGFFRDDSYLKTFLAGFAREATARGYRMDLVLTQTEAIDPFRQALTNGQHGGFLVLPLPSEAQRTYLTHAHHRGAPVVFAFDRPEGVPWVDGDLEAGSFEATRHLLAAGRSDIHLLDLSEEYHSARARLDGFRRAHVEWGIEVKPRQEVHLHDYWADIRHFATRTVTNLFRSDRRPNALLVGGSRSMVEAAAETLATLGIKMPEEVALVGFEDHPGYAVNNPPLSAVDVPFDALGEDAADLLITQIEGGLKTAAPRPCPLMIRRSSRLDT